MDRTVKILLTAIALGLWVNAAVFFFQSKAVAAAQDITLSSINNHLNTIEQIDLKVLENKLIDIEDGACSNPNLCH
jgi:tryptophanyl-tRNA synthetase